MGGSSGGGGTTTATNLPQWISGPHKNLVSKAESFVYGDRGAYVPYTNDRIAGFNPSETAAFQARSDLFNRGDPMGEFAQGQLSDASTFLPKIYENANQVFNDQTMQQYMSPYIRGVIDPQLREANLAYDRKLNQSAAESVARGGAVGSYRQGLERALMEGQRAQTLSDITGKGMQSAYETGLGAFQRDRDARTQGALSSIQAGTNLAGAADSLGTNNLVRMSELASGLERSGATQRELAQKEQDLAYSDFVQERDWPMRNMSYLASILSGVPNAQFTQQQQQSAQPGLLSQLTSLGLGAAALQQAFGGGRAGGGLIDAYAGGGSVPAPPAKKKSVDAVNESYFLYKYGNPSIPYLSDEEEGIGSIVSIPDGLRLYHTPPSKAERLRDTFIGPVDEHDRTGWTPAMPTIFGGYVPWDAEDGYDATLGRVGGFYTRGKSGLLWRDPSR